MKKLLLAGLLIIILSACGTKPAAEPIITFTPPATAEPPTATALPTPTDDIFAAQVTPVTETPPAECKDEALIASWTRDDVVYDYHDFIKNKPIPPNGHFNMMWVLLNSGTCAWDESYIVAFKSGHIMTQSQSFPLTTGEQVIAPGQTAIINISMVAPSKTGGYQSAWEVKNAKGNSLITFNIVTKVDRGSSNPPSHPAEAASKVICGSGIANVHLSWVDTATNEDGYRLYRGGLPLLDLPAQTSFYDDVVPGVGVYEYVIVAYNIAGEAPANVSVSANCK